MPYCIYTNKNIPKKAASTEHILPLSLGGINGFEIHVDKEFNSSVGSRIDGKLADDFLVKMKRNETDTRGHSKKRPIFIAKNSMIKNNEEPVQVYYDKVGGLKTWSPKKRRFLLDSELAGYTFTSAFYVDANIRIRFVAKTALSASFFAYGDLFRNDTDHEELRLIMNWDDKVLNERVGKLKTWVDHQFSGNDSKELQIFTTICKLLNKYSCVGVVPSTNRLTIFVGILGHYIGSVSVPAKTDNFPNEGDYQLGHFITPQKGQIIRTSFFNVLEETHNALGKLLKKNI